MTVSLAPVELRYQPRGVAAQLFECRVPEVVLSGPAGTGKTRAWLERLHLLAADRYPGMRALIVRGGWDGHRPAECTELFTGHLRAAGFTVEVSETLDVYAQPAAMTGLDLVVQCWTGGSLTPAQEEGLLAAVRAGTGFAGWHGGMVATCFNNPGYQYLVGGRFVCHPGGFVDYRVDVTGTHPMVAGVDSFTVHTEQYFCHVDPTLTVLALTYWATEAMTDRYFKHPEKLI